jgi:hypothetical protein
MEPVRMIHQIRHLFTDPIFSPSLAPEKDWTGPRSTILNRRIRLNRHDAVHRRGGKPIL